jgi:NAD-dependent SIR2 family protein deacetylase
MRFPRGKARVFRHGATKTGVAVPTCGCGGAWKPAVISLGQGLVAADLERVMESATSCDLFVAAGTSLAVGPINGMFDLAASDDRGDGYCGLSP